MKINFTKMSGTGNDFIIFDNRKKIKKLIDASFIKKLCERKRGIGADGIILLEKTKTDEFKMRIFNPDGNEVEMCGNGARCFVFWLKKNLLIKDKVSFVTKAGILQAEIKNKLIKLKMTSPQNIIPEIKLKKDLKVSFVNTGVPHTVILTNNLQETNVIELGKFVRYHQKFQPNGTNVNFITVKDEHTLYIRTYERGVENETLSCGTGIVASVIISDVLKYINSPVKVHTFGGDILKVYFEKEKNTYINVYLEGQAEIIYEGQIII
ncbi:MAG: diaminopimelate epimerase [bacterium]